MSFFVKFKSIESLLEQTKQQELNCSTIHLMISMGRSATLGSQEIKLGTKVGLNWIDSK